MIPLPTRNKSPKLPKRKLNPELEDWGKGNKPRCKATNLGAYSSAAEIEEKFKSLPACNATHKWKCTKCGCWHYLGACRGPSGESSGSDKRKIEANENNAKKFVKFKRTGLVAENLEDKKKESKEGRFAHL